MFQVVICAGCDQYRPWGSLLVGITGYLCYALIKMLVQKLKSKNSFHFHTERVVSQIFAVDDPVDTIPIHVGTGFWGVCCVFIFGEHGVIMLPSTASAYVTIQLLQLFISNEFHYPELAHQLCRRSGHDLVVGGCHFSGVYTFALLGYASSLHQ